MRRNTVLGRMAKTMPSTVAASFLALLGLVHGATADAQTATLADQPVFGGAAVPGNLALVLSVEYPTAISVANTNDYADASTYLGYFDPVKCYNYVYNSTAPAQSYFAPAAFATGTNSHSCSGMWSGNFMNWATMQTIDPFRWALTGGYRSVDNATGPAPYTILEKAWGSFQGTTTTDTSGYWHSSSFPLRGTDQGTPNNIPTATNLVPSVTPFSNWTHFNTAIWGNGNQMVFSGTLNGGQNTGYYYDYGTTTSNGVITVTSTAASNNSVKDLPSNVNTAATLAANGMPQVPNATSNPVTYRVYVRVSVCDPTLGVAFLESNCTQYGSIYKPEGVMQKYSNQIRYADISYLNSDGQYQQGGVLREPMGFIGPTYPQPLSSTVITNTRPEWSAATGVQGINPDTTSASASGVPYSGVINFLNKFGEYTATASAPYGNAGNTNNNTNTYMKNDNVSELYYAAIRYFENLGNVSTWSTLQSGIPGYPTTIQLDGFPAVSTWTDPITYSCQKNFILGIGDDHTHFDFNVANNGGATDGYISRPDPTFSDNFNQSYTWTSDVETLEGLSGAPWYNYYNSSGTYGTYFMAGLAYGAHVNDIRSDLTGTQTISTYWMDVAEYGYPETENPYYLATKYGGFAVPSTYAFNTALTQSWWDTSNNTVTMHVSGAFNSSGTLTSSPQPDNYFLADKASTMVSGLQSAFANIASAIQAFTTSFSFSGSSVASTGTESFASQYSSVGWTGTVSASTLTFDTSGNATSVPLWSTDVTLAAQLTGTGWQPSSNVSTSRRIATWNGSAGVPFEVGNLTTTQLSALLPSYSSGPTATTAETNYIGWLRGDRTNEVGSTVSGSTKSLRARTKLLGDIVDANLTPVTIPNQVFSDANNPGYAAFKSLYANRQTMVYAGANDGMVHGFTGSSGIEQFAYIPSAVYQGPSSPSTPQVDGLAQLGNPNYSHHYYVDATPLAFDIDLGHTGGATGTPTWSTLLIGGLGKGGKSYYAIDVTDPVNTMQTEAQVASKVKWEFTTSAAPTLGFSFGTPVVVKTARYGWVVAFTSGYYTSSSNNSDGYGHLYLVNPATGALLQDIKTASASRGMAQAAAFVKDYSDLTADSIYVGDLNGQLWRFDLTAASGNYPAGTLIATLADGSGNAQPITTAPLIEISPTTRYRYVLVGTGQLLSTSDINSPTMQTFYAIIDGNAGAFNAVSTPITRSMLTSATDVTQGLTLSSISRGWYYDLGITSSIGYRVIVNPIAYNGFVVFSALLTSGDPCNPSGNSEVYVLDYADAKSDILATGSTSTVVANTAIAGNVTSERVFINSSGNPQLIVGSSGPVNAGTTGTTGTGGGTGGGTTGTAASGPIQKINAPLANTNSTRILNWREIPTAE